MKTGELLRMIGFFSLALLLLLLPGQIQGEMYVEGYLGGVQGANARMGSSIMHPLYSGSPVIIPGAAGESFQVPGRLDPAVLGGLKLGTWFVKEGFLGFNYPEWMKYFGFYLDFSYHRLDFPRQRLSSITSFYRQGVHEPINGITSLTSFWSSGSAATLAFMFAVRYGFLADEEAPFGRLQPYVAAGPAIFMSSQEVAVTAPRMRPHNTGPRYILYQIKPGPDSTANIALVVETGVRYLALKNVSIDISFKYLYAQSTYKYAFLDNFTEVARAGVALPTEATFSPNYQLFSG